MAREYIRGLNKLLEERIPENSIILVEGAPGTLKSGLIFALMSNCLAAAPKELGLCITLEQSMESHLKNIEKMGMKKPERLIVADLHEIRKNHKKTGEKFDIIKMIEEILGFYGRKIGKNLTYLALDSLNALRSFVTSDRKEIYHFFNMLRESNLTTFISLETPPLESAHEYAPEHFLADGIIDVGILEKEENVTRYIQIKKMRERKHDMKKHRLIVEKDGLSILGSVYG